MAKKSAIERNNKRKALVKKYAGRRERLKAMALNEDLRWKSVSKLGLNLRLCRATRLKTAFATVAK